MDLQTKLAILADAAKYDASCASSGTTQRNSRAGGLGSTTGSGICHSYTPDGRCVSLLKILLTNYCIYDCLYCINRVSSDVPRARFTAEEVVRLTLHFYRRNYIEGLFLSSGIIRNPDYTMEQIIAVAKTLRTEHQFRGYLHLKTIPEAAPDLLREAGCWADRISINIELPSKADVEKLAPQKSFENTRTAMGVIKQRIDQSRAEREDCRARGSSRARYGHAADPRVFAPAGQSTQMIVGATEASDTTILEQASSLYSTHKLRRVYYSTFSPIPDASSKLPLIAPPLVREHRLYQADWLMRFYGFSVAELTTPEGPNLDLAIDPKLAWALRNRHFFPVDLNKAPRALLLRVPGFGLKSVERILQVRRWHKLRSEDLPRLHVSVKKVLPFVITVDYHAANLSLARDQFDRRLAQPDQQLNLFATTSSVLTGQL